METSEVKKNAETNKMPSLLRNNWGRVRRQKRKSSSKNGRKQPEYFWKIAQSFNGKENLLQNPTFQENTVSFLLSYVYKIYQPSPSHKVQATYCCK